MNNLLAIETSGAVCSVCLSVDGNRFSMAEHVGRGHNERLLPMLTEVRMQAGLTDCDLRRRLDAVAFGCGPGSFTGVRIAAAAAQALALAADVRILRVPSSEALARQAGVRKAGVRKAGAGKAGASNERSERSSLNEKSSPVGVITLIRSRRDLYYLASYRSEKAGLVVEQTDRLLDRSPAVDWYREHGQWLVAGECPGWWQGGGVIDCTADAEQVLEIAQRMFLDGEDVDVADGLPAYLEGDSPWSKRL